MSLPGMNVVRVAKDMQKKVEEHADYMQKGPRSSNMDPVCYEATVLTTTSLCCQRIMIGQFIYLIFKHNLTTVFVLCNFLNPHHCTIGNAGKNPEVEMPSNAMDSSSTTQVHNWS